MRSSLSILAVLAGMSILLAQEQDQSDYLVKTDTISLKNKKVEFIGLPVIFYTPETTFGGGGGLQLFFNQQRNIFNARISNVFLSAIYTAQEQLLLSATPQFYLENGRFFLDGFVQFKRFPNSFWGIGNETPENNKEAYNMESFILRVAFLNRIPDYVNFGFEFNYENHTMIELADGGLLDGGGISGAEGARSSGLSFVFNFDDRDNVFSPVLGNYIIFKGGFSSKAFGATYNYNEFLIDLRKYFVFGDKHTFAAQAYMNNHFGNVPFQSAAWLGGADLGRGYFRGRYIDNQYVNFQSEFRFRPWKRIGVNAFAALGNVSPTVVGILGNPKVSFGGGMRWQITKSNPTLIRFDFGVNAEGGTGVYFGVNEAF